jgi:hypothetical protein
MPPQSDRKAQERRSNGEPTSGLADLRAYYKGQLARLVARFGPKAVIHEYGARPHAHGHGERGDERNGTVPWE